MDQVDIEAAEPGPGEEGFILQLRPPAAPGSDEAELALRIEQFSRLFLRGVEAPGARFAAIAPLTFAIVAPVWTADEVEAARIDLSETLFGRDDPVRVRLVRDANHVQPPRTPESHALADDSEDEWTPAPTAVERADFLDDDALDLDSPGLEIVDQGADEFDVWSTADEIAEPSDDAVSTAPVPPNPVLADALDPARWDGEVWSLDLETGSDAPASSVMDALAEIEAAFVRDDAERLAREDAQGAGVIGSDPVQPLGVAAPDFDERSFARDLDDFESFVQSHEATESADERPHPDAFDLDAFELDPAEALDDLTEAPQRRPAPDLAAELAAFREEMRAIAASIPGAGPDAALGRFRAEMDELAGALGQRVDGAAQRIEDAADRIASGAAERIDGAATRTERSAALIEDSVREAVAALEGLLAAALRRGPDEAPRPGAIAEDDWSVNTAADLAE